ncbi:unnamed protein product [Cylicostephanus goldi]|uniref:Uncharacterized protein n=1 Tax=Cylicostephanus goldi TaxID=71465 RepID=A0A3P6ST91_CYLGO|nr:unnamed protein product [Cylicostephanus goldi]
MRTINSLIVNDKLEKIQDQLNSLSLAQNRNTRSGLEVSTSRNLALSNRGRGRGLRRPGPVRPFNYGTRGTFRGSFPFRNPFAMPRNFYPFPPNYLAPPYPPDPGAYPSSDSAVYPPRMIDPAVYPPRTIRGKRAPNALPLPPANLFCILCLISWITPVAAQAYQICGSSQYAQTFSLPKTVACRASPREPMIATKVQLFGVKNDPLQLSGVKCY